MIKEFKDIEARDSGIIYNSILKQIKKLYKTDPMKAGELAISAIELVLTGEFSSDDMVVNLSLVPMQEINNKNVERYEKKIEEQKQKKIEEMGLEDIADLYKRGLKQRQIGEALGLSQQTVSYRLGLIKKDFSFLLDL